MPSPWENKVPNVEAFHAINVNEAVQKIVPYLEDSMNEQNQVIYFDGWGGLGASVVLKSLAQDPPLSLRNKFGNIIHIDCSKWKNQRTLQRTIAHKLRLPQHVMAIFDRQDEVDDFGGVDEGSRVEIRDVGRVIHQALQGRTFLVVFHNGSNKIVDLNDLGIPRPYFDPWSSNVVAKVLWTFRGRFRRFPNGLEEETEEFYHSLEQDPDDIKDHSSTFLLSYFSDVNSECWGKLLLEQAREIAYCAKKLGVTPEIVATCCRYILSVDCSDIRNIIEFNWSTHASNYWVCDGIIQDSQQHTAWEIAAAVQEEMLIEEEGSDEISIRFPYFVDGKRWITTTGSYTLENVPTVKPETTSFFARPNMFSVALPNDTFQRSEQLHVLKLCYCTFSFSSPPFLHCKKLRFLGLHSCNDQRNNLEGNKEEDKMEDRRIIEFFQSLWVLDICWTDWTLTLSHNMTKKMATNIREINIEEGRIWHSKLGWTWRNLQQIRKLRLIAPTRPWETENMDDFTNLVKLELLDLSGNSSIQVLPSLLGATALITLVLDGCIGLDHVGPEALPPSLETFSFDARQAKVGNPEADVSSISMTGCRRLENFRLCGSLPNLVELDLSNTSIKTLDLTDKVVQAQCLQRVILLGCKRLRAVLWPKKGMPKLMVLCIDTRGGEATKSKASHDSLISKQEEEYRRSSVYITDMRFLQSLMATGGPKFCSNTAMLNNLNIFLSCTSKDNVHSNKERMGPCRSGQLVGSPLHNSLIPKTCQTYSDVKFDKAVIDLDGSSAQQFEPLDLHVEIGEGISNSNVVTEQGIRSVIFFMNSVNSLLVHDNSSICTVITRSMMSIEVEEEEEEEEEMEEEESSMNRSRREERKSMKMTTKKKKILDWCCLKWCRVERCPKLDTVFATNYDISCFHDLETFWGDDLLMARCIWSKGRTVNMMNHKSFAKLKAILLHSCPRLKFVLPLSWFALPNLETVHMVYCGDLSQIFPVEAGMLKDLSADHCQRGVLEFPKLKNMYLQELPKLHQICEAKMFAPKLETIWVRGCWSLKRLPATADRAHTCPVVVDCEKDWWEKLEWDGKVAGHHSSLFEPRHSKYYRKKNLLRGTVLR